MIFNSLLIANRGEIACRIIKTARDMGIRSVAVYVDADKDALFVKEADEAIRLVDGGYLDSKQIINAAKKSGAQAIHPGYGFLSENASFARKVKKEGIIWVGPSPHVISVMGDKLKAKELAVKANVPTLPMTSKPSEAKNIGYPLLIKAAAGGGGKGMRIVEKEKDLKESISSAQREAKNGFNDDRIFIERYVEKSRHIEIQILGDSNGNVVHLGERECSIQRRHQKVVEEAPSPGVSKKTRELMGKIAVKLAKKVSYSGAGTVEFIMDQKENFYFLEMNTRVQVEHPITEMITGIDIVKEMIKVSAGQPLSIKQKDIEINGHAIECRICAEDPDNNFIPSPGVATYIKSPQGPGVRDDSSLFNGYEVTTFYDPMLSKLIVWGKDRNDAIKRMKRALEEYIVLGLKTNLGFLNRLMDDKDFISGKLDTGFIEKHKKLLKVPKENLEIASIAGAIILDSATGEIETVKDPRFTPWKYIARRSSVSRNSMF